MRICSKGLFVASATVGIVGLLAVLSALDCSSDDEAEAAWEVEKLGLALGDFLKQRPEMWLPGSEYTVTTMVPVPVRNEIWVGTTNGIRVCRRDGTVIRRVLQKDLPGNDRFSGRDYLRRRSHAAIVGIVPLKDESVWVRALSGSYRLGRDGTVLEDCRSDRRSVERQYGLIVRETRLQRFFPVLDDKVYLPLAGKQVGRYDGESWTFVRTLPADSAVRRIHLIGSVLHAAGRGGLINVSDGKHRVESGAHVEVCRLSRDRWLCVGGGVWLLDGNKTIRIDDYPEAAGLGACRPGVEIALWSCYDSSRISLVSGSSQGEVSIRHLELPEKHRWRGFVWAGSQQGGPGKIVSAGRRAPALTGRSKLYILTSVGLAETDLQSVKEIIRIPVPKLQSPWRETLSYGVPVTAAIVQEREILLGTAIGMARYTLDARTLKWVWRVSP